jgi:hypothetical protein
LRLVLSCSSPHLTLLHLSTALHCSYPLAAAAARERAAAKKMMPAPSLCLLAAVLLLLSPAGAQETCSGAAPAPPRRGAWMSVASFGAIGDGRTLNTAAFARAVARIERRRGARGGTLLYVPPGVWLTGPFNLTSHMTLFLARGAVIRATQVEP